MPPAYVHATDCFVAFGRPYFDLHKRKDAPAGSLGYEHRAVDHEYYQAGLAGMWSLDNPFPDYVGAATRAIADAFGEVAAEEYQADIAHDFLDLEWDGMSREERRTEEAVRCWLILHPEFLLSWAGVDVIRGRIHRVIDGEEAWENAPDVVRDYGRLRRYVERVLERRPDLRRLIGG